MAWLYSTARILLGVIFLVFGLNGFFLLIPVPEFHPFMQIMVDSGFIYVEKTLEVEAGLLLLANRYVQLALLLLGPIVMNIALYHLLIDPRNWPIAWINLGLYGLLVYRYHPYFVPLLRMRVD